LAAPRSHAPPQLRRKIIADEETVDFVEKDPFLVDIGEEMIDIPLITVDGMRRIFADFL
jgi:hypothetical protein